MKTLIVLGVILTVTLAQAETPWGLWHRQCGSVQSTPRQGCLDPWNVVHAFPTQEGCLAALNWVIEDFAQQMTRPEVPAILLERDPGGAWRQQRWLLYKQWPPQPGQAPYQSVEFFCLPAGLRPHNPAPGGVLEVPHFR